MSTPFKTQTCSEMVTALCSALSELAGALNELGSDRFAQPAGTPFGNSTVGMHVRHTLDHVRVLVHAAQPLTDDDSIDYDRRDRGTDVETSIDAARAEITRLSSLCELLKDRPCHSAVTIVSLAAKGTQPVVLQSTLGRECAFVLSHTIHHSATIRSMAIALHSQVSDSLGYAPSTPTPPQSSTCAR